MKNINYRIFFTYFILGIFLIISSESLAQNAGASQNGSAKVANDLTLKLQQKILLTNDQASKVHDIIVDYYNNFNSSSQKEAQNKILNVLDKKQKMKYDIIKSEWWNLLQKEISKNK